MKGLPAWRTKRANQASRASIVLGRAGEKCISLRPVSLGPLIYVRRQDAASRQLGKNLTIFEDK